MTPSQLKYHIESAGHESHFFDRKTMQFFGDRMSNYGVRDAGMIEDISGRQVPAWELWRKRPVKYGLKDSAYFHKETFKVILKK